MWCKSCTQWMRGALRSCEAVQRWLMTLGAVSVFLLLPQCQQGYPTTPTLCDEWCAARDRTRCANEDPAACVVWCERRRAIDVENDGPPGKCDGSRRAIIDCIQTLPDSVFDCADPSRVELERRCQLESLALSICESKLTASWPVVCNRWAVKCSSISRPDGDSWERVYESCLPKSGAPGCSEDQQILVDCLAAHDDLSCDVVPAENAVCESEKLALDSCHPLQRLLCARWADSCNTSEASCLAARPVDRGARCRGELDVLYRCFWNSQVSQGQRCWIEPLLAPECRAENEVFMACTQRADGGAFVP